MQPWWYALALETGLCRQVAYQIIFLPTLGCIGEGCWVPMSEGALAESESPGPQKKLKEWLRNGAGGP